VLTGNGVQVSFREKGSQIRVSPALFNTREEIGRFLDLAKSFA
jgi:selenocysteine lyase/cysteine desulfurase